MALWDVTLVSVGRGFAATAERGWGQAADVCRLGWRGAVPCFPREAEPREQRGDMAWVTRQHRVASCWLGRLPLSVQVPVVRKVVHSVSTRGDGLGCCFRPVPLVRDQLRVDVGSEVATVPIEKFAELDGS